MNKEILKHLLTTIIFILLFGFLTSSIVISLLFAIDYKSIYLITIILMICLFLLMKKLDNHLFLIYIKK